MKKSCLDKHEEELEKFAQNAMEFNRNTSVSTKDAIKFIKDMHKNTTKYHNKIGKELIKGIEEGLKEGR